MALRSGGRVVPPLEGFHLRRLCSCDVWSPPVDVLGSCGDLGVRPLSSRTWFPLGLLTLALVAVGVGLWVAHLVCAGLVHLVWVLMRFWVLVLMVLFLGIVVGLAVDFVGPVAGS